MNFKLMQNIEIFLAEEINSLTKDDQLVVVRCRLVYKQSRMSKSSISCQAKLNVTTTSQPTLDIK